MEIPVITDKHVQCSDGRFVASRPGPVEQLIQMLLAGLETARSKALQISGIHRPTIRATASASDETVVSLPGGPFSIPVRSSAAGRADVACRRGPQRTLTGRDSGFKT